MRQDFFTYQPTYKLMIAGITSRRLHGSTTRLVGASISSPSFVSRRRPGRRCLRNCGRNGRDFTLDDRWLSRLAARRIDAAGNRTRRNSGLFRQSGYLWVCGEHRVLCGDAPVLADVEKALGGELADMCFTDSSYNVNYENSTKKRKRGKSRPILNDALGEEFGAFLYDACVNILTVTKGAVYMCISSSELDTLQKAFREAGGKWQTICIQR